MTEYRPGRVVVGVSGSLGSLAALRHGLWQAHQSDRYLVVALAWQPPGGEAVYRRAPVPDLLSAWELEAEGRLDAAFDATWGGPPDHPTERVVVRGAAGFTLCSLADRATDLIVLGTTGRGPLARRVGGPVRRHVLANAVCPVLTAPAPENPRGLRRSLRRMDPDDFAVSKSFRGLSPQS